MERKIYMAFFALLLIAIIFTFFMQVQTLKLQDYKQWLWLLVILIIGLVSWLLSKKMKKEKWFTGHFSKG